MASRQKTLVIVVIWLVVAFVATVLMSVVALNFSPPVTTAVLYGLLFAAAAAATWAVARAPDKP